MPDARRPAGVRSSTARRTIVLPLSRHPGWSREDHVLLARRWAAREQHDLPAWIAARAIARRCAPIAPSPAMTIFRDPHRPYQIAFELPRLAARLCRWRCGNRVGTVNLLGRLNSGERSCRRHQIRFVDRLFHYHRRRNLFTPRCAARRSTPVATADASAKNRHFRGEIFLAATVISFDSATRVRCPRTRSLPIRPFGTASVHDFAFASDCSRTARAVTSA